MQRNLGRPTHLLLPTSSNLLKHQDINVGHVKQNKKYSNLRSLLYYDKGSKDLDPLSEGDIVRIKPTVMGKKVWEKGTVLECLDERSYNVLCDNGVIRRNRVHLRKSEESKNNNDNNFATPISEHDDILYKYDENSAINSSNGSENSLKPIVDANVNGNNNTCNETQLFSRTMRSARYKLPFKFDDYVVKK